MTSTLTEKTILITGANSGIGKAAAIQLAKLGATVIMACRSADRGAAALSDICSQSGSDKVDLKLVDLASQSSIREFCADILKKYHRLDVLIHNAANFDLTLKKPVITQDGVETIFATNHLAPFLMTHLLLDRLKANAPSRIITVASKGLITYPFLGMEFDNLNGERRFSAQHAYYLSKQAQVMFTYALARWLSGTGVTVNCVRVANVAIPDDRLGHLTPFQKKIYTLKRCAALTPEQQAETYVYLAGDPAVASITGGYWDERNHQVKSNPKSYDLDLQERLWEVSQKLTGVSV
jgi:NAD(P)-dependent dehydrogenase (short-subunit alcohol dehydrogenase family)